MKQQHNEDKFGFIFESALSAIIDSFSGKAKGHVDGKIASLWNSANNFIDGAGTAEDGTFDDVKKIAQDAAKEILDVAAESLRDNAHVMLDKIQILVKSNAKVKIAEATEWMQTNGKDMLRNTFTGRLTIQEWALVAIMGVDKVKEQILNEGELRFIGGKLRFAMDLQERDKVVVAFELYFFDESEKWIKANAFSTFSTMKFTSEALEEINSKGKVEFEVE